MSKKMKENKHYKRAELEMTLNAEEAIAILVSNSNKRAENALRRAEAERKALLGILGRAALFVALAVIILTAGYTGVVKDWLSFFVAIISISFATFHLGWYFGITRGIGK